MLFEGATPPPHMSSHFWRAIYVAIDRDRDKDEREKSRFFAALSLFRELFFRVRALGVQSSCMLKPLRATEIIVSTVVPRNKVHTVYQEIKVPYPVVYLMLWSI